MRQIHLPSSHSNLSTLLEEGWQSRLFSQRIYQVNIKTISPLAEDNWESCREYNLLVFAICRIDGYVKGTIKCPDQMTDLESYENWNNNDKYARKVIRIVIQRPRCGRPFEATHQSCGDQTENQLMRELADMRAIFTNV
jgi:hypothetical protein